ncbi:MAG: transketolase, partial [Bdellovibrionales bacterium]|nr:transketolase [Bdellovibrionales bacterium]
KVPPSTIFFLGRENFPRTYGNEKAKYELGKAQVLADTTAGKNKSVTLLVGGSLAPHALAAAETLAAEGIGTLVVNASCLSYPDTATLKQCLAKTEGRLVTAEDHQLVGGMGAIAVHALAQEGVALKVKSLGVRGEFGQSAYLADELYAKHGIDSLAMAEAVRQL